MIIPYGAWPSPLSVAAVIGASRGLRELWLDGDDAYWIESRPEEGGRYVIVRHRDGRTDDVTPPDHNARTRVHEYGGGSYTVHRGLVVFSEFGDGRLLRHRFGEAPKPLTPEGPTRFADPRVDAGRDRLIAVREDHGAGGEPVNELVAIDLASGEATTLCSGTDFVSDGRPSPDGRHLAWLTWSHPDMPWDATRLWVAELDGDGRPRAPVQVAGGPAESVVQPEWAPDGSLVFISDRSGWWNPYRGRPTSGEVERLADREAEFADPQWVFGMSSYGIDDDGTIVASVREGGRDRLLRWRDGRWDALETPYTELSSVRVGGGQAWFVASGPREPAAIVRVDLGTGRHDVVRVSAELPVDPAYLSVPEPISFPTSGGRTAHALFYPPTNPDVRAPDGELPPLIVESHGGPTANAGTGLSLGTQFFTSRGFALVDVDYGGSTGYGRAYREQLAGSWGIVDADDCTAAARALAERGLVDPERLIIRGGSAGGYTTLRALTSPGSPFAAGASHYGVGDLEALARDTHKFESRYLDKLVGPYPEAVETYRDRSPIHAMGRLSCPLIVLQGLDDKVVPPAQAEDIVAALDEKRIPYAYLAFEGEGHGFRKAESMARALEAELSFYAQLFGFEPADELEPVAIEHLDGWRGLR